MGPASISLAALVIGVGAAPATAAHAEQVHVQAREEGQGVLRERNGECFVLTPAHVAGEGTRLRLTGPGRVEADARLESVYEPDVAVLRVLTPGRLHCPSSWDEGLRLSERLDASTEAVVVTRNADGSQSRRFVRLASHDDRAATVRPIGEGDRLFKGLSGSMVEVRGAPIGMLVQVDGRSGEGIVFRLDYLSGIVESFFDVRAPDPLLSAPESVVEPMDVRAMMVKKVALRRAPERLSETIGSLSVGEVVSITGRVAQRLWYRIRTRDGRVGFVPLDSVDRL